MDYVYVRVWSIFVLLFSVIVHEYSHAYAALTQGDDTASLAGRLTLNPLPHIDPVGSLLVPLLLMLTRARIFVGWARPVPINPLRFRDMDRGTVIVSAAGPLANMFLGVGFALGARALSAQEGFSVLLYEGGLVNFWLAFFNLVPVPPLDGSKILSVLLPYRWKWSYLQWERYGMIVILIAIYSGLLSWISPLVQFLVDWLSGFK
ncbi:MAG TPA: site-2 protease family protein [bacterium]|nr:site-2 protease family protein [bacterium]